MGVHHRDLTAASASGGGYLVGTENTSFIELLRNRAVAYRMGARRLSGLSGNVTVPRQTAGATAYWLISESTQITESQQTFGQMSLTPKTVGAYTEISRQLLLQSSPDAEGIVTSDLASVTAVAYDLGVLSGSGSSGQPTGIVNTAGIGSVTGTSLAFEDILEFQTDVAAGNVFPAAGGYVTTHAVAALCIQRVKYTNTASPLWEGNVWDGTMVGFPAMASNQMSSATMLFGDWSQVVVGEWGVLEVEVNPFANFQAGIIGVRAISSMDCGLRYAAAFSYASSIT
jgi:HK97 family phage major capsid protein